MPNKAARNPELDSLASLVGDFIRYWGFKKVHGQIWLHIFLSSEPLDAAALIDRLGISKALVSMSVNDLLQYKVIFSAGKSERSTQLYRANPDLMEAILEVLRTRERKMLSQIEFAFRQVKKSSEAKKQSLDGAAINQLGEFIGAAQDSLDAFLGFRQMDLTLWEKFTGPDVLRS
jgi:DNA-binding transcriptional regulator GbsR (MarR family)